MKPPALVANSEPLHDSQISHLLLHFRARGYVVIPDVFQRDSVDPFLTEVMSCITRNDANDRYIVPFDRPEYYWPTTAPRLRQILPGALSPSKHTPKVSVFEMVWKIFEPGRQFEWHKDRDHEGMPGAEYHYPACVHIGMYFRDMTSADGPTCIVPGSHQDSRLNPFNGAPQEEFLIRKQDIVLFDQRCWHKVGTRTKEGLRIFALYGFHLVQVFGTTPPRDFPQAWATAWYNAKTLEDQIFYGGKWSAQSLLSTLSKAKADATDP